MKIKYGVQIFLHTTLATRRFISGPRSSNGKFRVKNTTKNGLLNVNIYETNSLNTDMKTSLASCPASETYITSTRKGIIFWQFDINFRQNDSASPHHFSFQFLHTNLT
jgi:hypothetical protein